MLQLCGGNVGQNFGANLQTKVFIFGLQTQVLFFNTLHSFNPISILSDYISRNITILN